MDRRNRERDAGESLAAVRVPTRRPIVQTVALALALVALAGPALAHGGSLGAGARGSVTVPNWLVVGTGGAVVGVSFLLSTFATDRRFLAAVHAPRWRGSLPWLAVVSRAAGALGVLVLVGVLISGFVGPIDSLSNPAILVVWVGWWAGYAMTTYLVGNTWPALNPWRTLARALPDAGRTYRWRWGAWPGVAALLALVWLEVVSPLADRPRALAVTVLAYTVVTLAGATVYGTETWFEAVDPVSRVFRLFGQVAPFGTDGEHGMGGSDTTSRLTLRLPGSALTTDVLAGRDEVAFVLALLWVTTFDGLVATPAWEGLARAAVDAGAPPLLVYLVALVAGFGLFWGAYVLAVRLARRTTPTYVSATTLARRFAPPLVAIAAGYHLAHFLGFFLSLVPPLVLAVTAPMATVEPVVFVLPAWFGGVAVAAVLAGHVLAVFAAHAVAFELFPDRLQAVRSQYPVTAAMIAYTMVSLWVVTSPETSPPFI